MFNLFTVAFAEGEAATTAAAGNTMAAGAIGLAQFLPLIFVFAIMWLMLIRPQKKKEKALREKISKMKVGDKVVTIGGIAGKISKIKDEFVIIETGNLGTQDEKSFIKFEKSAIKDVESKITN